MKLFVTRTTCTSIEVPENATKEEMIEIIKKVDLEDWTDTLYVGTNNAGDELIEFED